MIEIFQMLRVLAIACRACRRTERAMRGERQQADKGIEREWFPLSTRAAWLSRAVCRLLSSVRVLSSSLTIGASWRDVRLLGCRLGRCS